MHVDEIRQALQRKPFVPFTVHLAGGHLGRVESASRAELTDTECTLRVYRNDARDLERLISVRHIQRLDPDFDIPMIVESAAVEA